MKQMFEWLFRWQVLGRVALGIVGTLFVGVAALKIEEARGRSAWDRFQSEWESRGESFDWRRLVPAPVPDDENFAMAPLLAPLAKQVWDPKTRRIIHDSDVQHGLSSRFPRWSPTNTGVWRLAIPTPLDALAHTASGPTTNSISAARRVLDALSPYSGVLQEMTEAAQRPHARFNNQYEAGGSMLLVHLTVLKNAAKTFQHRATANLADGRADLAWEDVRVQLRLAESLRPEPIVISQLVRLAILEMALQTIWECMSASRWTEPQWEAMTRELARLNLGEDYRHCLRGEALFVSSSIFDAAIRGQPVDWRQLLGSESPPLRFMPKGWLYQNKLSLAKLHYELAMPVFDPATGQFHPERAALGAKQLDSMKRTPYNVFSLFLFPSIAQTSKRFAATQSAADMARIAIAIERHRLKFGMLPRSLSDLIAANLMDKIPADLIDGRPLRYSILSPTEYRIYSVGWNRSDELGSADSRGTTNQPAFNLDAGDWVWSSQPAAR